MTRHDPVTCTLGGCPSCDVSIVHDTRRIIAGNIEPGMLLGGISEVIDVIHEIGKVRVTVRAYGRITHHTLKADETVLVK